VTMPSQAHKIPRHGIFMGLAFTALCYWEATRRKEKEQIENDLPYLAPGSAPLQPGATPPGGSLNAADASRDESTSSPQITHATMPLYPLGHNPGGDGPNDDPDLSHLGLQVDFGNRLEKTVQITDLEKIENPEAGHDKGYSWDQLTEHGSVMLSPFGYQHQATHRMSRNPCAELYNDLLICERKFGWRAHVGDRVSMHEHELVCSPEKRKFFRCREASRDRRNRLYRLRMRQARGEQVGLASDPAPGEKREFDLKTKDKNGMSLDKWFSGKARVVWSTEDYKRLYGYPLEPTEELPPRYVDDGGHH